MTLADRLAELLRSAAAGEPPPVDLATVLLPRPPGPVSAVLGFTGRHVVAADVESSWLAGTREVGDFGSVMRAPFLAALGAHVGARVGHLDVVVVATAGDEPADAEAVRSVDLVEVEPVSCDHDRVLRALAFRRDLAVFRTTDRAGVVMLGRGLSDRWEISFEVEPAARGRGVGRALALAGLGLAPPGQPIFAQVSPGNVASLRVLLAAGYRPIGSEVLLLHTSG